MGLGGFAGVDDALGKGHVGGHEQIEGRAVDDFGGEVSGGFPGGLDGDPGLLVEGGEDGREERLKVGGGGETECVLLREEGGAGEEKEN